MNQTEDQNRHQIEVRMDGSFYKGDTWQDIKHQMEQNPLFTSWTDLKNRILEDVGIDVPEDRVDLMCLTLAAAKLATVVTLDIK